MTDADKIRLGATRFQALRDVHGPVVHDLIAENMAEWLVEHGYDAKAEVMAHVAGNCSEADWQKVIDKVRKDLGLGDVSMRS